MSARFRDVAIGQDLDLEISNLLEGAQVIKRTSMRMGRSNIVLH